MVITDEQIQQAERILLKEGQSFDVERRNFIKRLESGDLMAVPGSGKTTALQAKLYCLAQHLPLKDGRGILVLSHTNTAVEELKRLLQAKCPYLFEYPNYIGTIQQFVDKFLAVPFYETYFGKNIDFVDSDKYKEECDKYVNTHRGLEVSHVKYHFISDNKHYNQIRYAYKDDGTYDIVLGINGTFPTVKAPNTWHNAGTVEINTNKVLSFLRKMKSYLLKQGYLHYDDCFFLAEAYFRKNPKIINIIRERFQYVFVDEAQDTHKHQLDILDRLFDGIDNVVYQLIGDPNQSIFNNHAKSMTLQWTGKNPCYINNSIRLTAEISRVVNNLVIDKGRDDEIGTEHFRVTGLRVLDQRIAPQMILFDTESITQLKNKFKELIRQYNLVELNRDDKQGFHIIGWSAARSNDIDKLHLEDIFTDYTYRSSDTLYSVDTLSKAIQIECIKGNFKASRNMVLDCLFHTLNLMGARAEDGRGFNKTKLSKTLDGRDEDERKQYNENLHSCTVSLAAGRWEEAYNKIKPFITTWANRLYGALCNQSANTYLGNRFEDQVTCPIPTVDLNDDIPIEFGTVHSTKGQTHCATMYVETFFEGKYECQHLLVTERGEVKNPLFGDDVETTGVYASMARKMMYVGFSRPTHLLCYATEKKRWTEESLQKMQNQGWSIIDMT